MRLNGLFWQRVQHTTERRQFAVLHHSQGVLSDQGDDPLDVPGLQFDLSDNDAGDVLKYWIQIDNNSDFSSPVVDFTESSGSTTPRNNVIYTPSDLDQDSYYWRVKAIDQTSRQSNWSTANSGAVAFVVVPYYDDYSTWTYSRKIYFNTTSSGADISSSVTNFPVLIRLDASVFNFGLALSTGYDIRFAAV